MEYLIVFLIVALTVLIVFLVMAQKPGKRHNVDIKEMMLESERRQQETLFETQRSMQDALMQFQTQMSRSMKADLQQLNETTSRHLYTMQKDVNTSMVQGYDKTSEVFAQMLERMGKLDESQQNLKELSLSITHLQSILTDKKTRGIFGEIELYSLLEMAMGTDYRRYAKQYRLSNGSIVDAVVFASEPLHMICVDSKFPMENYNRIMQDDISVEERKRRQHAFLGDVKKHIKAIADKYIIPHETAEFAYMFIPAEAVFSYLHANCPEVIQYSYEQKVYLVSPTTLMAYITAIKAIYLGQQRNDHIVQIQDALKRLQIEFERFEKRYTAVSGDFEKCYQDMKLVQITVNKLLMRFKEIQEVDLKEEHMQSDDKTQI